MKRKTFDIIFIIVSAIVLTALIEFGILEKYLGFSLIPILLAYQIGQYPERKFKK